MRACDGCYANGEPVAEIARALARSPDAVVARRALLGIAPRRVPRPWSELEDRLFALGGRDTRAGDRARGMTWTVRSPDPRTQAPSERHRDAAGVSGGD